MALVGSVFEPRLGARYLALLRETAMRRQTREGWARHGGYFDGYVWLDALQSRKRTALARATGRRAPLRHPRSAAGASRARTRFRLCRGLRTSVTDGPPAPRPNGP